MTSCAPTTATWREHHGITAGKLKVGRDPERDLERLAIMRDALREGSGVTPTPAS